MAARCWAMRDRAERQAIDTLKTQLARELCSTLDRMHQAHAAAWLGVTQSDLSLLRAEKLGRFSVDRMLRLLVRQRLAVEIVLRPYEPNGWRRETKPRVAVVRHDRWGCLLPPAQPARNPAPGTADPDDLTSDW